MINQTSVDRLKAYAIKNYNSQGWDNLVECWTDAEIVEHAKLEGWKTYPAMFKGFADMFGAIEAYDIEVNAGRLNGYNTGKDYLLDHLADLQALTK